MILAGLNSAGGMYFFGLSDGSQFKLSLRVSEGIILWIIVLAGTVEAILGFLLTRHPKLLWVPASVVAILVAVLCAYTIGLRSGPIWLSLAAVALIGVGRARRRSLESGPVARQ